MEDIRALCYIHCSICSTLPRCSIKEITYCIGSKVHYNPGFLLFIQDTRLAPIKVAFSHSSENTDESDESDVDLRGSASGLTVALKQGGFRVANSWNFFIFFLHFFFSIFILTRYICSTGNKK
jgi:hypothetical protein